MGEDLLLGWYCIVSRNYNFSHFGSKDIL